MRILVAAGSFKDTYTSIEACEMIKDIVGDTHEVTAAPICDGGEYTFDILNSYYECREYTVDGVINPYGKPVTASYLGIGDEAYVISSEIIRLKPDEEEYKNPLMLSDYGLGQLIADAIARGFKRINLCLGGTSTVGYGIGTAQALGVRLLDENGNVLPSPIKLSDYKLISNLDYSLAGEYGYANVKMRVINDGVTRGTNLVTVNPLKIGSMYADKKDEILTDIDEAYGKVLALTGLHADDPFSGNGGGVYYGIEGLFHPEYIHGPEFFCEIFGLDDKIKSCDIIITGEGRYDNPHLLKTPMAVAKLAKKYNKNVIFICGRADETIRDDAKGQKECGIGQLLVCTDYYNPDEVRSSYGSDKEMYRIMTEQVIKDQLHRLLNTKEEQ